MEGTPFGRYRLVTMLGRGGMGEVWRAHDTETDRVVALKVLPAHLTDDDVFQQRFRREARAAAGLYEPHVVPIHHYGEINGRLYVDMRLIVGTDLDTLLDAGPLDPARAVKIVEQVASALHAAHQIGLAHRDVKPSNVLIAENDFAYLIDFGIAGMAGEAGATGAGSSIGTWAYLAPERFGAGEPDARSDIYALACVLHQCLTGRRPFPGDRIEQQVAGHMSMPPPLPSDVNHFIPTSFDDVIARGMAKNPDDRYHTTVALAAAASAAQEAAPVRTVDESSDRPPYAAPVEAPAPAVLREPLSSVAHTDERQPPVHRVPLSNNVFAEEDPVVADAPPPPPAAKPSPPSDWRASPPVEGLRPAAPGRSRPRVSPAIALFGVIVVVGVVIAIVAAVDNSQSSTDSTSEAIRSASVGDCITRVAGGSNSAGNYNVTVTPATCSTPAATHRVVSRTYDIANCGGRSWVESSTPAPPVVLCLDPE